MLQLKNIFKKYDRVIFDNLSISFPSKGFVFITGENGIGKTTLFNIHMHCYLVYLRIKLEL